MLRVDAPPSLGMFQAAMRKMATFEIVDGDMLAENLWNYFNKEELGRYMEGAGYDSSLF